LGIAEFVIVTFYENSIIPAALGILRKVQQANVHLSLVYPIYHKASGMIFFTPIVSIYKARVYQRFRRWYFPVERWVRNFRNHPVSLDPARINAVRPGDTNENGTDGFWDR
jgi:hypothetical protein